jgi:threonine/homoserine/homoserine lactone efflux protein
MVKMGWRRLPNMVRFQSVREARVRLPTDVRTTGGPGRAFREGKIVEALNPKTAVVFLAFIPQFIGTSQRIAVVLGVMLR